jgi:hypothetical protein
MHSKEFKAYGGGFSVVSPTSGVETLVIDENGSIRPSSIFGDTYFVDYENGADTNDGLTKDTAFKTLSAAYDACTDNNNDVIFIDGYAEVVETAMITWAKNRCHVIGVGGNHRYGQAAKVRLTATTGATNIATLKVTGIRNTFTNIKWYNSSTVAEGIYCVVEAGEYTVYNNCEFYKDTDLDETTASEILLNGDSAQFNNCTIGSLADAISGDIIHANVRLTRTISGKVMRDCSFVNCLFLRRAGGTTTAFVYAAASADVERMLLFENCLFINAKNAAAEPAQAIATGASLTVGNIIAKDCAAINCTKMTTSTGVEVAGPAYSNATGISVNGA